MDNVKTPIMFLTDPRINIMILVQVTVGNSPSMFSEYNFFANYFPLTPKKICSEVIAPFRNLSSI
jgi:hypothetical protein